MGSSFLTGNFVNLIEIALMHGKRTNILPYHTLRLVFEDPNVDPRTLTNSYRTDLVWTKIDDKIYDLYCKSTDWSNLLNGMFYNENHMSKPQETIYFRIIQAGDTSDITSLAKAFRCCSGLTSICQIDTSNVTTFEGTFCNALSLKTVPLFDTSKSTTMKNMFNALVSAKHYDDTMSLESVPLFNMSNVKTTASMFQLCESLKEVPLFDLSNVVESSSMFGGCVSLITVPKFDLSHVTNMKQMFSAYLNANRYKAFGKFHFMNIEYIPDLNTSSATNMGMLFGGCVKLKNAPLVNTENVTNMEEMFLLCQSLKSIPLYNTSNVKNMNLMFGMCYHDSVNKIDVQLHNTALKNIPCFDTSNVTNMSGFTWLCSSLESIPAFNTCKLKTAEYMYCACNYDNLPVNTYVASIPSYDFSNLTGNVSSLFCGYTNVQSGMLSVYNQLKDNSKITTHEDVFKWCGVDKDGNYASETAKAERAQIPKSWGGDMDE